MQMISAATLQRPLPHRIFCNFIFFWAFQILDTFLILSLISTARFHWLSCITLLIPLSCTLTHILYEMASWWWDTSDEPNEASLKIFIALFFLIILWFISLLCKQNKATPPLPPGPNGLPFVGYLPFLGSDLLCSFTQLARTYGPIFKVRLGTKTCIVISSPSFLKEVVRDQDVTFANRDPTVVAVTCIYGGSDIAFTNYGPEWRKLRKILASEMLSNSNLDSAYHFRKQQVKKMIADTYDKAGGAVDVGELAFLTIMNSMMSMVLGQTLEGNQGYAVKSEFRDVIREFMELLGAPNISDLFPLLARFDLQGIKCKAEMISRQFDEILDSAINIHNCGEKSGQKDFLGCLLALTKREDPTTSLTLVQAKATIIDIIIGGVETTVSTVEWATVLMLKHPKVMRKVQEELTEIVGLNTSVEDVHFPKLEYLKAVVKETLRLHPPIPFLVPHCPSKSTTVGGYTIPKGAQIYLNLFAMQKDAQLWGDPLEFKPERFLKGSSAGGLDYSGNHLQYLPFGSGRRACPGVPLADRMLMLVLASLLHAFEWSLPNGVEDVDLSERFGIVVKKSKPLLAIPCPRLSSLELYSYSE